MDFVHPADQYDSLNTCDSVAIGKGKHEGCYRLSKAGVSDKCLYEHRGKLVWRAYALHRACQVASAMKDLMDVFKHYDAIVDKEIEGGLKLSGDSIYFRDEDVRAHFVMRGDPATWRRLKLGKGWYQAKGAPLPSFKEAYHHIINKTFPEMPS